MADLKPVPLFASNYRQIPETLRVIAQEIEDGKHEAIESAAVVIEKEDGGVEVFGLGDSELVRTLGLLLLGQHRLAAMRLPDS